MRLHHVQLSMPRGEEALARRFYGEALGLSEVEKPPSLAGRGGCWFRSFDDGTVISELHLGVDDDFIPARKAHPALVVDSISELEAVATRITQRGFEVSWVERETFEGYIRFHARDGFGNRIELLAAV